MKKQIIKSILVSSFLLATIMIAVTSCKDDIEKPQTPSITVSPASGKAGDEITISGTNLKFSTKALENTVTFNNVSATVVSATATQLVVAVPPRAGDGRVDITIGTNVIEGQVFDYIESIPVVSTLAGSTEGFSDGQGSTAQFNRPYGITIDATGNVYVTDLMNNRIRKITSDGLVSTLAGSTEGYADGQGANAQFNRPKRVVADEEGNIYVSDSYNHRIRKISAAGLVSIVAGGALGSADGQGVDAQFSYPSGVTFDTQGNLYVTDQNNDKIRKINPDGLVSTLAGSREGNADGQGGEAQFYAPDGIVVDKDGNLYVADVTNDRIRKISPSGLVSTLAGSTEGFADGQSANAQFNRPTGIAIDIEGNLYVADALNHRIRKITPNGLVSTFAGSTEGYSDGSSVDALFNNPVGIGIDAVGNIYVADRGNHRIRKITFE